MVNWITRVVHDPRIALAVRVTSFLVKLLSLSLPCAPYAANQWLMYPLLSLAAMDLLLVPFSLRLSTSLLAVHFAVALTASNYSRLCEAGNIVWEEI